MMKILLIDGNSLVNRAFYGVHMLNAPDGTPTNGVYGFVTILRRILLDENPDGACVAFDLPAPTFRHLRSKRYKAQRKPMPEELRVQMPLLKQLLDAMGIARAELEGYEADDILGTLSLRCESAGHSCVIVTGDKDSFQLISPLTTVKHVKTRGGHTETVNYTPERFFEEYGFAPPAMVDLKALMGDASDNIPGVTGIGEKTALALIRSCGSVERVYSDLDALEASPSVKRKLAEGRQQAELSRELAQIVRDAPLDTDIESLRLRGGDRAELLALCRRLGFQKFIEQWGLEDGAGSEAPPAECPQELPEVAVNAENAAEVAAALKSAALAAVVMTSEGFELCDGRAVYTVDPIELGGGWDALAQVIFGGEVRKSASGLKELLRELDRRCLPSEGFVFDVSLAGYLLNSTAKSYEPETLASRYLQTPVRGARCVYELTGALEKKLEECGMTELFERIELPLCRVLADMEETGFLVDRKALYDYGESLVSGIDALQSEIWQLAGEEFNINSPKQLGQILFDKLLLPDGGRKKSTSAEVLEKLRGKHPIVQKILDYRTLAKLKSTYADGLLKVIEPDGRIRTSFRMTATATGRLSSTEPNLQNIPVRRELGGRIRGMFVAPEGRVLVDADYSQIELRLLAHISGDDTMREAFESGEDIHAVTASQVFGVPLGEVTPELRRRAKAVNFGIVYGISAFSLAQDIGVYTNEAKAYMDAYLARYHGVREYMKDIVAKAAADGYVSTIFGRRRYLPELHSPNRNLRAFGERVALNMPVQGAAADIIKLAMVNVHRRLKAEGLEAKLILQVHDELIVECPEAEAGRAAAILSEEMQSAVSLTVPLAAEAKSGRSWAEAH